MFDEYIAFYSLFFRRWSNAARIGLVMNHNEGVVRVGCGRVDIGFLIGSRSIFLIFPSRR